MYGSSDEVLSGLKLNSINDLLYSYVSGIQSENFFTQISVIDDFSHNRTFYKNPQYLYNAFYRDFAGADLTAWIYDMVSPESSAVQLI